MPAIPVQAVSNRCNRFYMIEDLAIKKKVLTVRIPIVEPYVEPLDQRAAEQF